jgi:hypothetical protein
MQKQKVSNISLIIFMEAREYIHIDGTKCVKYVYIKIIGLGKEIRINNRSSFIFFKENDLFLS